MPRSSDDMTSSTTAGNMWAAPSFDNHQKVLMKRYRTEIAASSASLLSTLTAYPLDSVKTRMQAYRFSSFVDCVRNTYAMEGMHGFWRGALAPLMSITAVRTISFSIYQKSKYTYDDWIYKATGHSPLVIANTKDALPNIYTAMCFGAAGATSGALITAVSCPFELTKLNAQIAVLMERGIDTETGDCSKKAQAAATPRAPPKSSGTLGTARMIIQQRGVQGLYSGFHLHLLRDTIGTCLYFTTYESSKQILANGRGNEPTSPLAVVVAGGMCGLVSWACIYPIDSAKSIYQRNVLMAGFHQDPLAEKPTRPRIQWFNRRMYRGLGVSMTRSCLINAIFFSAFELMKKQINRLEIKERDK